MYLNWKWMAAFAVLNLAGGIAAALADSSWRALICGAGFVACVWTALDDYEKGAQR